MPPRPVSVIALALLSHLLDDERVVLALPVLINLALLGTFGWSLRGVPMVERFARIAKGETLSDPERAHCRQATYVWIGFFVINASVAGALALWFPLSWWAVYTGLVAYGLMGVVFLVEYVVRIVRFADARPFRRRQSREPVL